MKKNKNELRIKSRDKKKKEEKLKIKTGMKNWRRIENEKQEGKIENVTKKKMKNWG